MTLLLIEHSLSAFEVFTLLSTLANIEVAVISFLAESLRYIADAKTACDRVQRLIEKKPITTCYMNHHDKPLKLEVCFKGRRYKPHFIRHESFRSGKPIFIGARKLDETAENIHPQVVLSNVSCFWSHNPERPAIYNLSLSDACGKLVGITGPVGSGKTSLLMSILGELPVSGKISCIGKIAYVSQTPWVFSGSVRENIVFGMKFDEKKFSKIIKACDLVKDISSFQKRGQTEIGQRGVILSGGQRARVSLARALYSDADIYLLDDPLSAVDAKVGKHLFHNCIKEFLAGRIRILVTHHLQYLSHTDNLVLLQNGCVVYQGTFRQMEQGRQGGFSFLTHEKLNSDGKENKDGVVASVSDIGEFFSSPVNAAEKGRGRVDLPDEEEDRMVGAVKWWSYWKYLRASLSVLLIVCLAVFFAVVQSRYIRSSTHPPTHLSNCPTCYLIR